MRRLKYLLILLFLLIIVPDVVLGDNQDDRTDNNHIVSVEDIYINGSDITVKGYAFISHMDNYGLLDDVGNIKSYVVAYNDNDSSRIVGDGSAWFDSHLDINPGTTNAATNISCKSLENCYVVDTDVVARDMWFSRCVESCDKEQAILNARKNDLINSSACRGSSTDCIYYNVGFAATIELDVIISSFLGDRNGETTLFENIDEYDEEISFAIVTINADTIAHIEDDGEIDRDHEVRVLASYLPVNPYICNYRDSNGNKVQCSTNEEQMTSGLFSFSINELPSKVSMDAREAIPKWNCDGTESVNSDKVCSRMKGDWVPTTRYFAEKSFANRHNNLVYRTAGWVKKTIVKPVDEMDASLTTYEDGLFKLEGYECDDDEDASLPNKICPVYDEFDKDSRSWNYYWADANWVKANGIFIIKSFKINVDSIECSDINNGKVSDLNGSSKSTGCDNDPSANVSFYSCDKISSIESTIYLKEETPQCTPQYVTFSGDSNYYIPITIHADILVEQEGKFHFADFGSNPVRAGKGFSINNITNGISYNNNLKFIVANKYSNSSGSILKGTPYISYDGERRTNGCEIDSTFNLTEKIMDSYNEGNSGGQFYYKDGSNLVGGSSLFVMINAIENAFISSYAPNYNNKDDTNDKSLPDMFKFKSCDSNSPEISCGELVDVDGIWNSTYSVPEFVRVDSLNKVFIHNRGISPNDGKYYRGFGKTYSSVHKYNLPYSYVALGDTTYDSKRYKFADIVYTTSPVSNPLEVKLQGVGNKYFVGFKYAYNNFPFDLSMSDISFSSNMSWFLNGTCGVEVDNGLFGDDGQPLYKYRPISLNKPFPNAGRIATNWLTWYGYDDNKKRLDDTYSNDVKYQVVITKTNDSDEDTINIKEINDITNYYGDLTGISHAGVSDFVTRDNLHPSGKFKIIQNNSSYCGLGFFSSTCDG